MAYTLDNFCTDAHALLQAKPLAEALPQVAERLSKLLVNPQFVTETFNDDMPPGKRVLHHDRELDFYVLVASSQYGLAPGQTRAYGPNVIHSTAHKEKAWVIRVTGTDLDKLPRYHFRKQDKILEAV